MFAHLPEVRHTRIQMKNYPRLVLSVIGCELVGILGSIFSVSAIPTWYATLNKPFFAPPNWIFGPVWTLLYLLMGISLYLIWELGWNTKKVKPSRNFFILQLALNFIWSPVFFGAQNPEAALVIIVAMWLAIVYTIRSLYPLSRTAAYLLVPYLFWVSFATVLNAAIVVLN